MLLTEIKIHQIRAARSLLDWTQDDLAERSGISKYSVTNMEGGRTEPQKGTLDRIIRSLELAGIEFIEEGVRLNRNTVTLLKGDDWFLDVLDDVYKTLEFSDRKELLIFGGNNSVSPPEVIERFRKIRAIDIKMREMVKENDTYLMGPTDEYRWIPAVQYRNDVKVIYGDKVLLDFGLTGALICNAAIAEVERNQFNLLWSLLPVLNLESTADVRY